MIYEGKLTDVKGISLGHAEDFEALTGTSAIIIKDGAVAGVDVRGSAPGTRETDLLRPENLVDRVYGVSLSGGSAYGLDASSGIMKYLEEEDIGMDVTVCKVPIVVGAVIFDLAIGNPLVRPDKEMGYRAAKSASYNAKEQGCIGAGTGASVGKIMGNDYAMKSGLGQASISLGDFTISALTVLNAFGDIYDYERGIKIAGVYDRKNKKFLDTLKIFEEKAAGYNAFNRATNTTISLLACNGKFDKAKTNKIAQMAHDGYARSIVPVHTMFDGDTIFALSTGQVDFDVSLAGSLGAKVISRSIANAIYSAEDVEGLISYKTIKEGF